MSPAVRGAEPSLLKKGDPQQIQHRNACVNYVSEIDARLLSFQGEFYWMIHEAEEGLCSLTWRS